MSSMLDNLKTSNFGNKVYHGQISRENSSIGFFLISIKSSRCKTEQESST